MKRVRLYKYRTNNLRGYRARTIAVSGFPKPRRPWLAQYPASVVQTAAYWTGSATADVAPVRLLPVVVVQHLPAEPQVPPFGRQYWQYLGPRCLVVQPVPHKQWLVPVAAAGLAQTHFGLVPKPIDSLPSAVVPPF